MKPLGIDLFCGLGGWTEGLLAEGYYVVGFDNCRHIYGEARYPGQLVIQDVLTLHGRQFKDAALIVGSPPCQAYSYRAMPWKRAKAMPPPCNALFDACFRIQAEAIAAAGHFIPLIVENVRGAQPYVGRSRWNYGSFHLWGDVPALMPMTRGIKNSGGSWFAIAHNTTSGHSNNKRPGHDWNRFKRTGQISAHWRVPDDSKHGASIEAHLSERGNKGGNGRIPGDGFLSGEISRHHSGSAKRKAASAAIAKVPLPLARHIARIYRP